MRRLVLGLAVYAAATAAAAEPSVGEDYLLHCSGCHGAQGRGLPGQVPALTALAPLAATERGRIYLVQVPGVAQASLDDARLARLLNWVVAELSGAHGPPFRADEVARWRQTPLRDPTAARAAALAAP